MDERESPSPDGSPSLVVDAHPFERAGELLAGALEAVLAESEQVRFAIPGGSALEAVRQAQLRVGRAWRRVRLSWVDERCVSFADAASNRGAAARRGLLTSADGASGGSGAAYVLPLYEDGETPAQAVERVGRAFKHELDEGLDVVCLGMGPDGHVASLFPGLPSMRAKGWVAHVADSPKPPASRITLTRAALTTARQIVLVAAGEEKRDALNRLLEGDPALPAQGLKGMIVVTDLAPA